MKKEKFNPRNSDTLLISGGGMKGLMFVGALRYMEEISACHFTTITGVSVGSLLGLLLCVGYSSQDLEKVLCAADLRKMSDVRIQNLLSKFGLDNGNKVMNWIGELLHQKGLSRDITFSQLKRFTKKDFVVYACNVDDRSMDSFCARNTPNLKVLDAIRMSISIPFYFTAKKYNGKVYVDGGVISSFPIDLVERDYTNVLGVKFKTLRENATPENLVNFCSNVMSCVMRAGSSNTEPRCNVMCLQGSTPFLDFSLTTEDKIKVFQLGYSQCRLFFETSSS
jgi:predicted acylesterase/phospholipase RssA